MIYTGYTIQLHCTEIFHFFLCTLWLYENICKLTIENISRSYLIPCIYIFLFLYYFWWILSANVSIWMTWISMLSRSIFSWNSGKISSSFVPTYVGFNLLRVLTWTVETFLLTSIHNSTIIIVLRLWMSTINTIFFLPIKKLALWPKSICCCPDFASITLK